MAGTMQPKHILYVTTGNGNLTRFKAQWMALGISIRDLPNGSFEIDALDPNNAFLKESVIIFTGDANPHPDWQDIVYLILGQLESLGACVVSFPGYQDVQEMLPWVQFPHLLQYIDNEIRYWVWGGNRQVGKLMSEQELSHHTTILKPALDVLTAYRAAIAQNQADVFLQSQPQQVQAVLKNITADVNTGRARHEYAVVENKLLSHLMHVAPGMMSFLEYLLIGPDVLGFWKDSGLRWESESLILRLALIRSTLQRFTFDLPVRPDLLSEAQKKLYANYFYWSILYQRNELDYFDGKSTEDIMRMAMNNLTKITPGGLHFEYLRRAASMAPFVKIKNVFISRSSMNEHASQKYFLLVLRHFLYAIDNGDQDRLKESIHRMILQSWPGVVRQELPFILKLSDCEKPDVNVRLRIPHMPQSGIIYVYPYQQMLPTMTPDSPLALTWHPNGASAISLAPLSQLDTHAVTLRQHCVQDGILSMLVQSDGQSATCTQAVLTQSNRYFILKNPALLSLNNTFYADFITPFLWFQIPSDKEIIHFFHGMVLHVIRPALMTEAIWGEGGIPTLGVDKKAYIVEESQDCYRIVMAGDSGFQSSQPVPVAYLKALIIWQYAKINQFKMMEVSRIQAADEIISCCSQLGVSLFREDIVSMAQDVWPNIMQMNVYLSSPNTADEQEILDLVQAPPILPQQESELPMAFLDFPSELDFSTQDSEDFSPRPA